MPQNQVKQQPDERGYHVTSSALAQGGRGVAEGFQGFLPALRWGALTARHRIHAGAPRCVRPRVHICLATAM